MLTEFLRSVASFIDGFPPIIQFLALFVLAAIPLVESEVAAALGVLLGVPVPLAIIAAAAGTSLMTIALTALGKR